MLKSMGKKIFTTLRSKILFNRTYVYTCVYVYIQTKDVYEGSDQTYIRVLVLLRNESMALRICAVADPEGFSSNPLHAPFFFLNIP